MKSSATFVSLLLALLLGVGIALIRPTQPVQVGMMAKPAFVSIGANGLDNDAIVADDNIQPARKCRFILVGVSCLFVYLVSFFHFPNSLCLIFSIRRRWFLHGSKY
jgi:hypothetical protein